MGAAGQLNPQQTHFLDVVKGNTERLTILVNDLLDVSRIEAGKVSLSFQPLDLHSIVEDMLGSFERRMTEENHILSMHQDVPADLPLVQGDPERVRQILDNIIENAYQYTPAGGQVWVTLRTVENEVHIEVRDNGIGIRPEEKERVFERFYRGEDPLVLATSGTGLGLSIVQTLVDMHGGRLWFESEGIPGLGSVFTFTLPIYDPNQPTEPVQTVEGTENEPPSVEAQREEASDEAGADQNAPLHPDDDKKDDEYMMQ